MQELYVWCTALVTKRKKKSKLITSAIFTSVGLQVMCTSAYVHVTIVHTWMQLLVPITYQILKNRQHFAVGVNQQVV